MRGVTSVAEGLRLAQESGLDLVELSPNAVPPVCKVMNYGKYRYEMQKKAQEAKKKQKVVETKEVKFRPNIAVGDYNVKLKHIEKFIKNGDKVRVSLAFRGREIAHKDIGFALMEKIKVDVDPYGKIELEPKSEGKQILMVVIPR